MTRAQHTPVPKPEGTKANRRLRLGIDGRFMTAEYPGICRYSVELIHALAALDAPADQVLLLHPESLTSPLFDRKPMAELSKSMEIRQTRVGPRSVADQWSTPRLAKKLALDVFLSPFFLGPMVAMPCPRVVVIHDIGPLRYPATVPSRMRRLLLPHLIRRAVKSASSLITPSVATREDLQGWFSDLSPTVHVIPEAPAEHFRPSADHEVDRVRKRYALHEPFVLFVGSKRRHKRIDHLIDAWGSLDQELTSHRTLVLAGAESNDSAALRELVTAHGLEQSVRFLGRIPEPDLAPLYSAAELFVLPSLFEGFGLTMVEAMACATPVLCSNSSSLAEISGEAALLFDPKLPGSLTQQLVRLLSSAALRSELAEAAFQRAQSFSWHRAAENTLQVLIEAAQSRSRAGR